METKEKAKVIIEIETETEAFNNFNEEIELILNWTIVKILQGQGFFSINDSNGNKIGFCQVLKNTKKGDK